MESFLKDRLYANKMSMYPRKTVVLETQTFALNEGKCFVNAYSQSITRNLMLLTVNPTYSLLLHNFSFYTTSNFTPSEFIKGSINLHKFLTN